MRFISRYYLIIIGSIVFCFYLLTVAPSIVELDSGELATVQAVLGIAHPTGYPLFAFLGYLFTKLPLPLTPVFKSNLLAMLWTLGSVLMFAVNLKIIYKNFSFFSKHEKEPITKNITESQFHFIIIISSLIYAFSRTVWLQSTSVEVYSLHLLLINIILFFFFKGLFTNENKEFRINKWWIWFSIFLGLSFANHLSTIYLLPGLAVLFFWMYGFKPVMLKNLLALFTIVLVPVLFLYGLMMLRSSQHPLINWGHPSDLESLIYHITGMQYRGYAFSQENSPLAKLTYFLKSMDFIPLHSSNDVGEFGISLVFLIFGIYFFVKRAFKLAVTFFVFILTTLLFTINYGIPDIDAYFLLAYMFIAVLISGGIVFIFQKIQTSSKLIPAGGLILIVITVLQIWGNFGKLNQSKVLIYEDFTEAILKYVEPNAVIFCNERDKFIATLCYYQSVLGKRKDVLQINVPLLSEKWYRKWLNELAPGTIVPDQNSFKVDTKNRPVYISLGLFSDEEVLNSLGLFRNKLAPEFLFYRQVVNDNYYPAIKPKFELHLTGKTTPYTNGIEEYILVMMLNRLRYEYRYKQEEQANLIIQNLNRIKWRIDASPFFK